MAGSHLDRLELELGAAIHPESRADFGSWHHWLASARFRQWQSVAARRRAQPGFVKDDL
jgi:hypothetical protein